MLRAQGFGVGVGATAEESKTETSNSKSQNQEPVVKTPHSQETVVKTSHAQPGAQPSRQGKTKQKRYAKLADFYNPSACGPPATTAPTSSSTPISTPPPPPTSQQHHPPWNLLEHFKYLEVRPLSRRQFAVGATPVEDCRGHPVRILCPAPVVQAYPALALRFKDTSQLLHRLQARPSRAASERQHKHPQDQIQNNEAGPPLLSQTMESAGLDDTPRDPLENIDNLHPALPLPVMPEGLDTPAHVTDHGVPSNLRNADHDPFDERFGIPFADDPNFPAALPTDDGMGFPAALDPPDPFASVLDSAAHDGTEESQPFEPQPGPVTDEQQQLESGYAMLSFNDSYHVLKTPNIMLGRDLLYADRVQQMIKDKRRQAKEEKRARRQANHTRRALNNYAKEPSQPSQNGEDVAANPSSESADGDALEGRPASGLLSHYSEQGGPVAYNPPPDEDLDRFPRGEHRRNRHNSSSATSVAPHALHTHHFDTITMSAREGEVYTGSLAGSDNREDWAELPIHTANPDDIKRISREHLIFSYDPDNQRWVVHVVGNNAFVDDVLYERGHRNIPLKNGTEIHISTVRIVFRLPILMNDEDSLGSGEEVDEHSIKEAADSVNSSPERPGSIDEEDDAEDEDAHQPEEAAQRPSLKLKLSARKPPAKTAASGKGKGKGGKDKDAKTAGKSKTVESKASEQVESGKTSDKTKGKKTTTTATTTAEDDAETAKAEQNGDPRPMNIQPGSILEHLAPDQMPEKRKGPGRPPKNGLLSKRDERAVTRRKKEYERRGMPVPDFNSILADVREEQKAKDAAAKGNKLRPEGGLVDAVESIEGADPPEDGAAGATQHRDSHASQSADPSGGPLGTSGLSRRPLRSPSPMKPQHEFTEEQLKRPQASYFYLLDEILQAVGQADLQTIYDKFQKKWPYYKYGVNTNGWQSSIRHNLSQSARFKAIGRVGKGQLWAIDETAPRDENTKKKKTPPPPRQPQMPLGNGSMLQGMHPQYPHGPPQQYQPHYNQQPPYNGGGQGQYSSPYGTHPGQYQAGPHPPNMQAPNGTHMGPPMQGAHMQHPQNPQQPAQQAPSPSNPVERITQEIMAYRMQYLSKYPPDSPEFKVQNDKFFALVTYLSDMFHGSNNSAQEQRSEEELRTEPYVSLKAIFDRHDTSGTSTQPGNSADQTGAGNGSGQGDGASTGANAAPGQTSGQGGPAQNSQPALPQYQQYNGPGNNMPPPTNSVSQVGQGVQQTGAMPPHVSDASQGAQQTIASQTADAVALSDAANHTSSAGAPHSNAPTEGQQSNGAAAITTIPTPSQQVQQQVPQTNGQPATHHQQQSPQMAAPSEAHALQQQMPTAPPEATAKDTPQPPPTEEQARPMSAGVKRGAEDVETQDAESDAKRQRTE